MRSIATPQFRKQLAKLPKQVKQAASKQFRLWSTDPEHPSLNFKPLRSTHWSVRITRDYRAVARIRGDEVVWIFIGSHADYDEFVKKL